MAKNPKILSIVLAGGEGTRLMPLTRDRAKPAVPFGGVFRLIDFPLSNLVNSGYMQTVVLTQYKSHSLDRHISTVWRFSPLLGNYVSPVPAQQRLGKHWYLGSADAIYQTINIIEDVQPDIVVIVGADHVYRMDFEQMVLQHIESGASQQAWPALVIDGVDVTVPSLFLNANSASDSTANLVVRSGSLTVEDMAFTTGDACVTGGTLTVSQLMDCTNLVCRGGAVTITEGWGFSGDGHQAVTPTVLLTGGTLDANVWMPETIEYQLWSGTITVPGVRHWPNTHLLGDDVTIIDPLDDGKTN